jgi:LmbE family N-acetylglucosaminyl deacetylase
MSTTQSPEVDLSFVFRSLVEGRTPIGPVALIVAHPDDEVIGVGGQLGRWADALACIYATDGAPVVHGAGIGSDRIRTLGFRDQELVFTLTELDAALDRLLADIHPAAVITHAFEGGHPDHDALALVLACLIRRRRMREERAPLLIEFAGYWLNESGALVTNRFASPNGGERQLRMSTPFRQQKNALLASLRTRQHVLRDFETREEWIRPAPAYDFRTLPNQGRVWYDRFDWPVRSDQWLHLAAAYLDRAPTPTPLRLVC